MPKNGQVEVETFGENTDRLAVGLISASSEVGLAPPHESDDSLKQFLRDLKSIVAEKKSSGGSGGPPPKMFLGQDFSWWLKLIMAWVAGGAITVATWFLAIRDGLHARPTKDEVHLILKEYDTSHSSHSHPITSDRIKAVESQQRVIRDSQIRQETLDETQTETLKEIKEELRQIRRSQR